ncbi:2OG-Fe(II) oxygenase [Anabaena subtropica]|uniref:2OG-Fe(II) oxygenase n=1 Tax=Anabaena subtropica FACHB-260 TaxID=2692884 RepID=A0ABR8CS78_9NOST|nr:2OG-Fe(II) oxygenase [Anabaena subtropica]MBD2345213.1 2OG-Fe(II) oxygenase [Anabaena subtropica FACHB-260]
MKTIVKKVRNEIIRKIYRIPLFSNTADIAYQTAIAKHTDYLPALSENDFSLVENLQKQGIVMTSLTELSIPSTVEMLQSAQILMPTIPTKIFGNQNEFTVHTTSEQMVEHSDIFLWGLQHRLLNIVENYLGLSVAYHGAYFRRDINNQIQKKSRLWHLDKEDRKMLKIIIYLNDVNEETGPFQYIPKCLTSSITRYLKYDDGYIKDEIMEEVVSSSNWKSCIGNFGTVIFVDTANVFHRGKLPLASDRLSIFFDYTTRQPKHPFYCKSSLAEKDLLKIGSKLSVNQKQYVFWQHNYN